MENQYFGRCMRCKKQMEVQNPEIVTTKKGGNAIRGICICGTKMFKFIAKDKTKNQTETKTAPINEPISPFISPIDTTLQTNKPKVSETISEFKGEKTITNPNIEKEIEDWDKAQL